MAVHNTEIADMFEQLADLLEIREENPFRIRAYRNAARVIRAHPRSMAELVESGADLEELPGIGKDLAGKIATIVRTGKLPLLEQVHAKVPRPLVEMTRIEGLGPKRAKALYRALKIRSLEDLQRAARSGRIRELKGFGARTEQLIEQRARRVAATARRIKLADAEDIAGPLVEHLRAVRGVKDIEVAGSYRRRRDTVGDLDVLVSAGRNAASVMDEFVNYEDVVDVLAKGPTRGTVRLRNGLQVDIRIVAPESLWRGASLLHWVQGTQHRRAKARGGQGTQAERIRPLQR